MGATRLGLGELAPWELASASGTGCRKQPVNFHSSPPMKCPWLVPGPPTVAREDKASSESSAVLTLFR